MQKERVPVYFMPGMAANSKIFEYINLDDQKFEVTHLSWIIPQKKESIEQYARRLAANVTKENCILIGVSFGGIMVQEMSRFIKVKKVIIISSVKHQSEFPTRMKWAKRTKLYKCIPTRLVSDVEFLSKYVFGETAIKRVELYKKYLSVSDKRYLDWAFEQIVNWKQRHEVENLVHIHGTNDKVFPVKYIKGEFIEIPKGTHVMIINKFKWFNENLPQLLTT